jgi:hypothetical protein
MYSVQREDPATTQHDQFSIVFVSPEANSYLTFQFTVTPYSCISPNIKIRFSNIKNIILSNIAFSAEVLMFGPN